MALPTKSSEVLAGGSHVGSPSVISLKLRTCAHSDKLASSRHLVGSYSSRLKSPRPKQFVIGRDNLVGKKASA